MRRLALLIAVVLVLTACGGSSKSNTPPETGPSPAFTKQTIRSQSWVGTPKTSPCPSTKNQSG